MRASQRTKMVKPAGTAAGGQAENRTELKREVPEQRDAELRTPTKRRRILRSSEQDSAASTSRIENDAYITPTKQRHVSTSAFLLPTPPATPTISISPSEPSSSSSTASSTSFGSSSNVYARARSLLRLSAQASCSTSDQLVGRTIEREQLDAFLRYNLPDLFEPSETADTPTLPKSKALYISGSPGTGKTALLKNVLDGLKARQQTEITRIAFLNCTTVTSAGDIWERIAAELELDFTSSPTRGKGKQRCDEARFLDALEKQNGRCLVILDEIDHLLATSTSSDSLSRLFATALLPSSNLVLVGIANALDLTQRHLNILADAQEDEDEPLADPELLHFRPFQSDEMVAIVKARLSTLHASSENAATLPLPIVMPAALELAAKKVAAVTGDLRSFLSLIRKAVEIFEGEQRKRFATANVEESPTSKRKVSPSSSRKAGQEDSLAQFDAVTAPKLTPAHILKATRLVSLTSASGSGPSGSFGSSSQPGATLSAVSSTSLIEAKISDLNLHQRLVLTSFLVSTLQKQARVLAWSSGSRPSEAMKPGELHSAYRSLLEKDDVLHAVGSNEFSDLVSGLHTRGLVGFEREYSKASSPTSATLAPPMMRRSSSSSSTSSRGGRGSRSPSPSAAQAPLVLLYGTTELAAAIRAAKPAEAAAICNTVLNREEKRIRRLKAYKEQEEAERKERINAPREGFNGDGLDDLDAKFVGKRDKRGRAGDQDEEEDLEGQIGQDDGTNAEEDAL